jgi:hypothetical protein
MSSTFPRCWCPALAEGQGCGCGNRSPHCPFCFERYHRGRKRGQCQHPGCACGKYIPLSDAPRAINKVIVSEAAVNLRSMHAQGTKIGRTRHGKWTARQRISDREKATDTGRVRGAAAVGIGGHLAVWLRSAPFALTEAQRAVWFRELKSLRKRDHPHPIGVGIGGGLLGLLRAPSSAPHDEPGGVLHRDESQPRLDADHPENGVLIPCRVTRSPGACGNSIIET